MAKTKKRTGLGRELEAALKEVAAHRQGEFMLAGRVIEKDPKAVERALSR